MGDDVSRANALVVVVRWYQLQGGIQGHCCSSVLQVRDCDNVMKDAVDLVGPMRCSLLTLRRKKRLQRT